MSRHDRQSGFTLLEVIITLSVGAILMVAVLPYVGMTRHSIPQIFWFERAMDLQAVMENFTSRFEDLKRNAAVPNPLQTLKEEIENLSGGFGDYQLHSTEFVKYREEDGNYILDAQGKKIVDPDPDHQNLLVSIKNSDGLVLTTMFSDI